ncbi:hypothetical protein CHS0354_022680 [Potamilus streckersoni]|uniref:Uncharacterized protein n=1 Tax=Potamilus streckersoni TaxID=2493646 RepID=A0AAE0S767_9BIVA|nr:hypothetical protein CHS0354_022680 [Potamilus streckersoni]
MSNDEDVFSKDVNLLDPDMLNEAIATVIRNKAKFPRANMTSTKFPTTQTSSENINIDMTPAGRDDTGYLTYVTIENRRDLEAILTKVVGTGTNIVLTDQHQNYLNVIYEKKPHKNSILAHVIVLATRDVGRNVPTESSQLQAAELSRIEPCTLIRGDVLTMFHLMLSHHMSALRSRWQGQFCSFLT